MLDEDDDEDDGEPEFIDLAELGSKVPPKKSSSSADSMSSEASGSGANGGGAAGDADGFDMEDDEEVWICRFCDRAFDTETDLTSHEKQHS